MTLGDLKKIVNKLSATQLKKELIYHSKDLSISGVVIKLKIQGADLLWDGGDDPSTLYTRKELKENGVSKEDIEEMDIEIMKGDIVIEF